MMRVWRMFYRRVWLMFCGKAHVPCVCDYIASSSYLYGPFSVAILASYVCDLYSPYSVARLMSCACEYRLHLNDASMSVGWQRQIILQPSRIWYPNDVLQPNDTCVNVGWQRQRPSVLHPNDKWHPNNIWHPNDTCTNIGGNGELPCILTIHGTL